MLERFRRPPDNVEPVRDPYAKPVSPLDAGEAESDGPGVMVTGAWSPAVTRYVNSRGIEAVYLNVSKGWSSDDYAFLSDLTAVRHLHILTSKACDLSAVEGMTALETLSLTSGTRSPIHFPALKKLRRCFLSWWPEADSIFACPQLESLYLDRFKTRDYDRFQAFGALRELTIGNSTLPGIGCLTGLTTLEKLALLNCRKIDGLAGIETLQGLRWLAVSGSPALSDIGPVAALKRLEILDLADNRRIASLSPLAGLENLKALTFAGRNTVIEDGDLGVLETLPLLSMLNFVQRRHYTHRLVKKWSWRNFDQPDRLLAPAG